MGTLWIDEDYRLQGSIARPYEGLCSVHLPISDCKQYRDSQLFHLQLHKPLASYEMHGANSATFQVSLSSAKPKALL